MLKKNLCFVCLPASSMEQLALQPQARQVRLLLMILLALSNNTVRKFLNACSRI